jgi:RHS repeat-associated protein
MECDQACLTTRYTVCGTVLYHEHLERDPQGRVKRVDERWAGVTTTRRYEYDDAGRLWQVMDASGTQLKAFEYDHGQPGNGNRTAVYGSSTATVLASAEYDDQDRMTVLGDATYSWSAAGELSQRNRPGEQFMTTYDALGNLSTAIKQPLASGQAPNPTVTTTLRYAVDGANRRVRRWVDGSPDRGWLYRDDLSVAAELNGNGTLRHRYLYGTLGHSPDLLMRGDTAYRVVTDHLGSVRAVVRTTDGVLVQRLDHDEWGVPTLDQGGAFQSLGYAGGLMDRETELVRFGARDYEPRAGRWTAKDPVGFASGSAGLYTYALNAPTYMFDANGAAAARAGRRPLGGLPPGGMWPDPTQPYGDWERDADKCNCELSHEGFVFSNGERIGFGPGGVTADTSSTYILESETYDEDLLREAISKMMAPGSAYDVFHYNCQIWADHVRAMYRLLLGARERGVQRRRKQ